MSFQIYQMTHAFVYYFLSFYSFESFSHQRKLMISNRCLSGNKSPQISRILHSILADLNAVAWMVSACSLISKSSSPSTNHFMNQTHQLQLLSPSLSYSIVFHFFSKVFLFAFFQLCTVVSRNGKVHYSTGFLFMLT